MYCTQRHRDKFGKYLFVSSKLQSKWKIYRQNEPFKYITVNKYLLALMETLSTIKIAMMTNMFIFIGNLCNRHLKCETVIWVSFRSCNKFPEYNMKRQQQTNIKNHCTLLRRVKKKKKNQIQCFNLFHFYIFSVNFEWKKQGLCTRCIHFGYDIMCGVFL